MVSVFFKFRLSSPYIILVIFTWVLVSLLFISLRQLLWIHWILVVIMHPTLPSSMALKWDWGRLLAELSESEVKGSSREQLPLFLITRLREIIESNFILLTLYNLIKWIPHQPSSWLYDTIENDIFPYHWTLFIRPFAFPGLSGKLAIGGWTDIDRRLRTNTLLSTMNITGQKVHA